MTLPVVGAPASPIAAFSLERRLMLRLGALYIVALVIMSAIYLILASSYRHIEVADDVDPIAAAVANAVRVGADGLPVLDIPPTLQARIDRLGDQSFAVIDRDTGRYIAGSHSMNSAADFAIASPPAGYDGDYFLRASNGETLYVSARSVDTPAGRFWVEFQYRRKASTVAREWIWEELGTETAPILLPLLAGTLLITWLTLHMSMRPLRRIAEDARSITSDSPDLRLSRDNVPQEILPMVAAANGALDRLEAALRRQRRLMANIAHELRTPLAILRARIESVIDPTVAQKVLPDFERISNLIGRLLVMTRLQSEHVSFDTRYELGRVIRECLAQMAPLSLARQKELILAAPAEPIFIRGNPVALEEAVRNLVDNALRFTAPGQAVDIHVSPGCVIEVRDHGPGVPPEMAKHVFEPFWRGGFTD